MGNSKANPVSQWFNKRRASRAKGSPIVIGTQPSILLDGYGRELQEGDEVILPAMKLESPRFLVAEIAPLIDLNAPPNMLRVRLVTTILIGSRANQPEAQLLKLRDVLEVGRQPGVQYQPETLRVLLGESTATPPSGGVETNAPDASAHSASADGSPRTQPGGSGVQTMPQQGPELTREEVYRRLQQTQRALQEQTEALTQMPRTAPRSLEQQALDARAGRTADASPLAEKTTRLVLP